MSDDLIIEQKHNLRRALRLALKNISAEKLAGESAILMSLLEAHPRFKQAQTVLLFHSLPDEPNTQQLLRRHASTKRILLPAVVGETELELRNYSEEQTLKQGAFGILEATGKSFTDFAQIDLAIVPGLAFDRIGNRMGRGRGYYDRLLSSPGFQSVYKLGLCFQACFVDKLPTASHDIRMDEVLYVKN